LPAVWSDDDETVVQSFVVHGAPLDDVASALYAPASTLVATVHRERGHTSLSETDWTTATAAAAAAGAGHRKRYHQPAPSLPTAGATRTLRFQSPSPAPAISGPGTLCWSDDQQRVLVASSSSSSREHGGNSGGVFVVQSDVRTGVPYGDKLAVIARVCLASVGGGSSTLVRISYCVRYDRSLPRLLRGMVARGVDGGVRPTYAAIRKALPAALASTTAKPPVIEDVPPSAPLPPALRLALASLAGERGAAKSPSSAGGGRGAAASTAAATTTIPTAAAAAAGLSLPSPSLLLLERALLPPASAARALVELVGDPLLFARAVAGLLTLAVLAVAVRATRWFVAATALQGSSIASLLHPPESTAQALTGALLLLASNRVVDALMSGLAATVTARVGTEAPAATEEAAAGADDEEVPNAARRRGKHTSGGGSSTSVAADLAVELAAATATRLISAADKARTSVAAQLRPRAAAAQQQLLRETQHELEAEASRRLRQRQPPMPRPPEEQATASLLLGGAPLTVVEDYVSAPAEGEAAGALAPVDLFYERPRRSTKRRPRQADETGAAASSPTRSSSSRSPPPPLPRSPSLPVAPAASAAAAATAHSGVGSGGLPGPLSVKGKAWSSTSLPSRGNNKPPRPPVAASNGASPPAPASSSLLDQLAVLPDGDAAAAASIAAVAQRLLDASPEEDAGGGDGASDAAEDDGGGDGDARVGPSGNDDANNDSEEDDDEPPLRELFENERKQAWGWGHSYPGSFLPSDRLGRWSDREGRPGGAASARPDSVAAAQPPPGWAWARASRWRLDITGRDEGAVDASGWAYAVDFPQLLALHASSGWPPPLGAGKSSAGVFVRRRRWVRAVVPAAVSSSPVDGREGRRVSPPPPLQSPPPTRCVDSSDEEEEAEVEQEEPGEQGARLEREDVVPPLGGGGEAEAEGAGPSPASALEEEKEPAPAATS
jgi:hypothetical protein